MSVTIYQGDCRAVLPTLPAGSVQMCVTSPPYFGLRDYQTGTWEGGDPACGHTVGPMASNKSTLGIGKGEASHDAAMRHASSFGMPYRNVCGKCGAVRIDEQIGLEETPDAYVAALVAVFREVRRVLRDDGTLWLNIGDSYASAWAVSRRNVVGNGSLKNGSRAFRPNRLHGDLKEKDLIGIPWMLAFALRADGWYLRSDIIWSKPNGMPEPVTDRPTKAHEYLFLLSKSEHYFYDASAIAEASVSDHPSGNGYKRDARLSYQNSDGTARGNDQQWQVTPTRNKRSVWTVATTPYSGAHFATFPEKLIEPCILAGTSPQACEVCGAPWRRMVERSLVNTDGWGKAQKDHHAALQGSDAIARNGQGRAGDSLSVTTGWQPTCPCPNAGTGRCVVLDPFFGSGTTGRVAIKHGRACVAIELNPEYIDQANVRTTNIQMVLT